MNQWRLKYVILLLPLLIGEAAFAHAFLTKVSGTMDARTPGQAMKNGPCGRMPDTSTGTLISKGPITATFQTGQTITVTWDESINHTSVFEINILRNNDTASEHLAVEIPDNQNTFIGTGDPNHHYSMQVTLPTTPCAACTLQLIQLMRDMPPQETYYYSCADIAMVAPSTSPTPAPSATPQPTPSATPINQCPSPN